MRQLSNSIVNIERRKKINERKRNDPEYHKKVKEQQRACLLKDIKRYLLNAARRRGKFYGTPFNIIKEDFELKENCDCCGKPMQAYIGKGKRQYDSYSLDCVNPTKGYINGNVAVICWRCNKIKQDGSLKEHKQIVRYMERYEETSH